MADDPQALTFTWRSSSVSSGQGEMEVQLVRLTLSTSSTLRPPTPAWLMMLMEKVAE